MPSLLQTALDCAARGWYVFPCLPASKQPATSHGFKDATTDPAQIERWWLRNPQYNVAVACGASNLCVVDIDHGLQPRVGDPGTTQERIADARERLGLPASSYAVRTGKRSDYGLQIYLEGAERTGKLCIPGKFAEYTGDIKSAGGYVMAAGSVHPDSGEAYELLDASLLARKTEAAMAFRVRESPVKLGDGELIEHDRNSWLTRAAGKLRSDGFDADTLRETLHRLNERRMAEPLPADEVDRIADNASRWAMPTENVEIVVGAPKAPVDPSTWRGLFHTREDTENTPDPEFLIRDFLQAESVTGVIGPARARKSIVVLNVIHSLLTGKPLFGKFEVTNRPERVVYLCPESGKKSLGRRLRNMDLVRFVGDTLFFTSMNSDPMTLNDARLREAVRGSVLVIDTAIRFFDGDENSSQDMKLFGEQCHALIRDGVNAVLLLHHTAKASENITLESGRGSGDFGGFLTCCWGTTLSDYEDAYNAQSLMSCVKQRDFQADSFKLEPSGNQDDFFLRYVDGSENVRLPVGAKEKAGKAKAVAYARAHPGITAEALREALAAQGIKYSESSCRAMLRGVKALDVTSG